MELILAVTIGFVLDYLFGDPAWLPHPIRLIGLGISKGEALLRKSLPKESKGEFWAGVLLTVGIVVLAFLVPWLLLALAAKMHPGLKIGLEAFFCFQILAAKSLKTESMRVYTALQKKDLPQARTYLSWIVGRDTQRLQEAEITKAAVETVAENTVDGVVAPLLFLLLGGAPFGFLYKAVNTLDSMIGYKNPKYLFFGRFAARLDDVLNFIPAILSAYLMIAATWLLGLDVKNAYRIYRRDKRNHASPNSAKTEAVCAGALGIQLAGDSYYFGKLVHKQTIGDPNRRVEIQNIVQANRLMYRTAVLALVVFGLVVFGLMMFGKGRIF